MNAIVGCGGGGLTGRREVDGGLYCGFDGMEGGEGLRLRFLFFCLKAGGRVDATSRKAKSKCRHLNTGTKKGPKKGKKRLELISDLTRSGRKTKKNARSSSQKHI